MTPVVVIACVALALGVVMIRRRSHALTLVTAQSLLLAGVAVGHAVSDLALAPAAAGLLVRAGAIAIILGVGISRTPERRLVRSGIEPMTRAAIGLAALLVTGQLVALPGEGNVNAQRAAIALVVLGIVIAMTRHATIVQILGIVVAENGATLLALSATDAVPGLIELGVIFDLLLIAVVATAFHARIFGRFGSGDTSHLRGLHD